jgi:hypothetical protein
MKKAFVDTTIMTDYLLKSGKQYCAARDVLAEFEHSELPAYAIKEFAAGPIRYFVWMHNKLASAKSLSHALSSLQSMSRSPRKYWTAGAVQALKEAAEKYRFDQRTLNDLVNRYGSDAIVDEVQADQFRLAIKEIIYSAWADRRSFTSQVVEELDCFSEEPLRDQNGVIEIVSKCKGACAVAKKLASRPKELKKLVNLLKDSAKSENKHRYKALHDLARKPKVSVDKNTCRNFGDAVIVILAPHDSEIVTTNEEDFRPLADALGKSIKVPS